MRDTANNRSSLEANLFASEPQLPDFRARGYKVMEILGRHLDDRRISYLAIDLSTDRQVVIKQYQTVNGEADYASYRPEIDRLCQLKYPNIPAYYDSFAIDGGFCVVRQYQPGQPISKMGALPPADIKTIGDAVLKILAHIQRQNPVIIHHNIKAENIIVETDEETQSLMVFLVDFGFHRQPGMRTKDIDPTGGMTGFAPPERFNGKPITSSADMYSLGVTLISLILGRSSHLANQMLDSKGNIEFQSLLPATIHPRLTGWLNKMVDANPNKRYANASSARSSLSSIPLERRVPLSIQLAAPQAIPLWKIALIALPILGVCGFVASLFFFNDDDNGIISAKGQALQKQAQIAQNPTNRLLNEKSCIACNLSGQSFSKAELNSANLNRARLNNTNFSNADLSAAIFQDADLSGANLNQANLREAGFYGAKLLNADLSGANLSGAKLVYAKATGGMFRKVDLSSADLKYAELQQVDLSGANLSAADLRNADLSYANLRGANLDGALLDGTILTGATMSDGKIHQEKSNLPITTPSTIIPNANPKLDPLPTIR